MTPPAPVHGPALPAHPAPERRPAAEASAAPLIALRRLSVRLGNRTVLHDLSMAVHAGDRIALVGANGSGKTTLLRALHGLLPPAARVGGERLVAEPAPRQAMLFQRPFLLRLSVRRNLLLALWLAGVPRAEQAARAAAALARVNLQATAERPARVLSGGQQQRLALARAWAVQPQLLFLDEPTASLDPQAKRDVEDLIAEFAAEGMTVVMSSHNLGQVKRLASRVIHLEDGQLTADRSTESFFHEPLPPAAAAFLRGELP